MNIRIECVAGDPPTWKVFLGTFFWSCTTKEEAKAWAEKADAYIANFTPSYQLPSPPSPTSRPGRCNGLFSLVCYLEDTVDGSARKRYPCR